MIEREALKLAIETAQAAGGVDVIDVEGQAYFREGGKARLVTEPRPAPLNVHTLNAFAQYIAKNRDSVAVAEVMLHVETPTFVKLVGPYGTDGGRTVYVSASPSASRVQELFGRYVAADDFIVSLLTMFKDTPERADLMRIIGNVSASEVRTVVDDGFTQEITSKVGGVKPVGAELKNPVMLSPLRSFPEVELSPVPFVVRAKKSDNLPYFALFECDGGAWQIEATQKIAEWLQNSPATEDLALIY